MPRCVAGSVRGQAKAGLLKVWSRASLWHGEGSCLDCSVLQQHLTTVYHLAGSPNLSPNPMSPAHNNLGEYSSVRWGPSELLLAVAQLIASVGRDSEGEPCPLRHHQPSLTHGVSGYSDPGVTSEQGNPRSVVSGKTAYAGVRVSPGRHSVVSEQNLSDLRPRRQGPQSAKRMCVAWGKATGSCPDSAPSSQKLVSDTRWDFS